MPLKFQKGIGGANYITLSCTTNSLSPGSTLGTSGGSMIYVLFACKWIPAMFCYM